LETPETRRDLIGSCGTAPPRTKHERIPSPTNDGSVEGSYGAPIRITAFLVSVRFSFSFRKIHPSEGILTIPTPFLKRRLHGFRRMFSFTALSLSLSLSLSPSLSLPASCHCMALVYRFISWADKTGPWLLLAWSVMNKIDIGIECLVYWI
jgi:hypothetical protein